MSMDHTNAVQDEQFSHKAENTTEAATVHEAEDNLQNNLQDNQLEAEHQESEMHVIDEEFTESEHEQSVEINEQTTSVFADMSKEQLVNTLNDLLHKKTIEEIKDEVELIKTLYYKKHKAEFDQKKTEFIAQGGKSEDFKFEDISENRLKELIVKYKEQRRVYNEHAESEKQHNLEIKLGIIENIKTLANGNEALHDTYNHFRELQKQWKATGPVPQKNVKDLYENYNLYVEKFYDFVKLNKELRDLDLKKNLQQKIELCEKAEELLLDSSVINAFNNLQDFHTHWREIGPVAADKREEVWERFKAVTTKINKAYQEHFERQKEEQKKNLEIKTNLCEKAEELLNQQIETMQSWEEKSKEMIELQQLWRTIGFANRKDNNKIYQRFQEACNEFFQKKKLFFSKIKEEQSKNYQLKLDLCIQAEDLKENEDWKKITDEFIQLQKKWKQIGPVPRKSSEIIWKRFRNACDYFFNKKTEYFANIDNTYEENLNKKLALIEEIKTYVFGDEVEKCFIDIKQFQSRWSEIGFVPLQKKEELSKIYREAIDNLFNKMKVDDGKRQMMKFKNKIDSIANTPKSNNKMYFERDKFISRLRKLEGDIKLWENNIGFFSKSKNAQALVNDVQSKIDEAKTEIKTLEAKITMIDTMIKE